MTRVQVRYRLRQPLDEAMMTRLSGTTAVYGIQKVKLAPTLDSLMVEYDATRMRPAEVASALAGAGIPIEPA